MNDCYGEYHADGSVTEPRVSILTGSPIFKDGSVSEAVGPLVFVRYEGQYADRVTDEMRAEWKRGAQGDKAGPALFRGKKGSEDVIND